MAINGCAERAIGKTTYTICGTWYADVVVTDP
jgi:hypothetical protein